MPSITVALLFRSILAFKAFDEVFLLTGGGPGTSSELLSLHLFKVFFEQNQLGYGAMLSVLTIIGVLMLLTLGWRAARRPRQMSRGTRATPAPRLPSTPGARPAVSR